MPSACRQRWGRYCSRTSTRTKTPSSSNKLKNAGAIILGKVTLGELGGGDTHGSLFGSTKTRTSWNEPSVVRREDPRRASRQISPPSASGRKGWHRYAGRQRGTASPACAPGRTRQPRRSLFRLAEKNRLSRTHGPHRQRPRETAGRNCRLRFGRPVDCEWGRPHPGKLYEFFDKDGLRRNANRRFARAHGLQLQA